MTQEEHLIQHEIIERSDNLPYGHIVAWSLYGALFCLFDQLERISALSLFVTLPLLTVGGFCMLIVWITTITVSLWKRRWRYIGTAVLGPALLIGVVFLVRYGYGCDWLRFQLCSWRYDREVQQMPQTQPRYRTWDWGETGGAGVVNIFHSLVYDETNRTAELALPNGAISVHPLGNHFFIVTEIE